MEGLGRSGETTEVSPAGSTLCGLISKVSSSSVIDMPVAPCSPSGPLVKPVDENMGEISWEAGPGVDCDERVCNDCVLGLLRMRAESSSLSKEAII
jgi:hypothetical protein